MVDRIQEFPVLNRALFIEASASQMAWEELANSIGVSYCHCDQFQATSG